MKYLLDINALVALCVDEHVFHARVGRWMKQLKRTGQPEFLLCSITELGFLRILAQAPAYNFPVPTGKRLLSELKASAEFRFELIADAHGADRLPPWVQGAKQITDGHLAGLAKAHGAELATLDQGIPGGLVIPERP